MSRKAKGPAFKLKSSNNPAFKMMGSYSPIKNDEKIKSFVSVGNGQGLWNANKGDYKAGDYVYLLKDNIKYYFVAKLNVPVGTMPPNDTYWIADECSKSLTGCRMCWGLNGAFKNNKGIGNCKIKAGDLPFGGFPAARKIARGG